MVALVAGEPRRLRRVDAARDRARGAHEEASYWLGPLLNNLGWEHYEAGDFDAALDAFERALRGARGGRRQRPRQSRSRATPSARRSARSAAPTRRSRSSSRRSRGPRRARTRPTAGSTRSSRRSTPPLGRTDDARAQAQLAIPLLERDDSVVLGATSRAARRHSPRARAECCRACASAWARAWRARSRGPRSAPGACVAAG